MIINKENLNKGHHNQLARTGQFFHNTYTSLLSDILPCANLNQNKMEF